MKLPTKHLCERSMPTPETDPILARMSEIEAQATLSRDPTTAAAQKRQLDHILTLLEMHRMWPGKHSPERDYVLRLAEAIIAKAAGYRERAEWSYIENAVRADIGAI